MQTLKNNHIITTITTTITTITTIIIIAALSTVMGARLEGVPGPPNEGCSLRGVRGAPSERDDESGGLVGGLARRDGADLSGFALRIEGDPRTYRPGHSYLVTLSAAPPSFFRGFTMISIREGSGGEQHTDFVGSFQLVDPEDTRHVGDCSRAVTEAAPRRRSRVTLRWEAPPPGSGCVSLSASLVQKRVIWFQEEGPLTKSLCERGREEDDTKKPIPQCCACDTAKYRLTFYGNWSEQTHPKDYPKFSPHWSAVIGASHSRGFIPWEAGSLASEGVRRVAEWGSPRALEDEMRGQGDEVLTVIKMKPQWPAWQPISVRAPPSAEFSVDRTRHLMTFLSMLGPSPDWAVGLSAENLCTRGCGWVQRVTHDLIPWDAGTDSGVTYQSPNSPTSPPEPIRPLTSLEGVSSPFYDPEGGPITPVARVVIERLARKGTQCNTEADSVDDVVVSSEVDEQRGADDDTPETCIYAAWSPWSSCGPSSTSTSTSSTSSTSSTTSSSTSPPPPESTPGPCPPGRQLRQRMLKAQLDFSVACGATQDARTCTLPTCPEVEDPHPECRYSEWSRWSPCSVSCAAGSRSRSRTLIGINNNNNNNQGDNNNNNNNEEQQLQGQAAGDSECPGDSVQREACVVNEDCLVAPTCALSEWTSWSRCSASCGVGGRSRSRDLRGGGASGGGGGASGGGGGAPPTCLTRGGDGGWGPPPVMAEMEKCLVAECPTFPCLHVSPWTDWSPCSVSCSLGSRSRLRVSRLPPDAACPHADSDHTEKCMMPECPVDCQVSPWSPWSPCSASCGRGVSLRTRLVETEPRFHGSPCPQLREDKRCRERRCRTRTADTRRHRGGDTGRETRG